MNEDLLHAVQTGNAPRAKEALERKGNPNYAEGDGSGVTPLYNAAGGGDFKMVKTQVELGADANYTSRL